MLFGLTGVPKQQNKDKCSSADIASTLSAIALIHYQTHSYTKSLEVYQEALRLRREVYGDSHLEVASTLNSIGLVLFKMELNDYAERYIVDALSVVDGVAFVRMGGQRRKSMRIWVDTKRANDGYGRASGSRRKRATTR